MPPPPPPGMLRLQKLHWQFMRTISLLRHAKSSWEPPAAGGPPLTDKARPLAARGMRDAPRIGAWMAAQALRPDLVLCSSAVRTRQTLAYVKELILPGKARISYRDDLYLAEAEDLVGIVQALDDGSAHVMLVGHDPGMHEVAQMLVGAGNRTLRRLLELKFPTAAVAVIDFPAERWRDVRPGAGTLRLFMAPKRLPD